MKVRTTYLDRPVGPYCMVFIFLEYQNKTHKTDGLVGLQQIVGFATI